MVWLLRENEPSEPDTMTEKPETVANCEPEASDCEYCYGVGACPRCWGRAAIEKLKRQIGAANERATIDNLVKRLRKAAGQTCERFSPPRGRADYCKQCGWGLQPHLLNEAADALTVLNLNR